MKYAIVVCLLLNWITIDIQAEMNFQDYIKARQQAANHKRRLIYNNDGCDAIYYPKRLKYTAENFLKLRTEKLIEDSSTVDSIFYCPGSTGWYFNFTNKFKFGELLLKDPPGNKYRNVLKEMLAEGTDPLTLVLQFGHTHNLEIFCSFRMNDVHDHPYRPSNDWFLYPKLKNEHPEYRIGNPGDRRKYCWWSALNFAVPEVRNLCFQHIRKVCENFDIDGIELDFLRDENYFKSVADGGVASNAERNMLTTLMQRIRKMTEKIGMKRGRPLLVAIRVNDSVPFCRDIGIDLEKWLKEGLVDIMTGTSRYQLNPWSYLVNLGHEYNVKVYACIEQSRIPTYIFDRNSIEVAAARAMDAFQQGCDGVYLFNYFDGNISPYLKLGDRHWVEKVDKVYLATYSHSRPTMFLSRAQKYRNLYLLSPQKEHWRTIYHNESIKPFIYIGDDFEQEIKAGLKPETTCFIIGYFPPKCKIGLSVNGHKLKCKKIKNNVFECKADIRMFKPARNDFTIFRTDSIQSRAIIKDFAVKVTYK